MLNTKSYSRLLRATAEQNGVELLDGRWTDGLGPSRRTIGSERVVTFRINATAGNFSQFITDLTVQTRLMNGTSPRFTAPRGYYTSALPFQAALASGQHTYVKFNCNVA